MLQNLTVNDADFFYNLYSHPALTVNFDESPFFTKRNTCTIY